MREPIDDTASDAYFGRFILSVYYGPAAQANGWFLVGADGSLSVTTNPLPFDSTPLFDIYFVAASGALPAGIRLKSVTNGKYLTAALNSVTAITASADTADEALLFIAAETWPPPFFLAQLLAISPGNPTGHPLWSYTASPLNLVDMPPQNWNEPAVLTMMCVAPGAPSAPPRLVGGNAGKAAVATSPAGAASTAAAPAFPYFAGKYALSSPQDWVFVQDQSGGWIVRDPDGGANIAYQAFPTDGSGLFVGYFQTATTGCMQAGNATGEFLTLQLQVMITMGAATIATAPAMDFTQLGTFFGASFLTPNDTTMTRVVAGLQDVLAPGAGNLWDGADLSYVDMRTCVGSLTGAAAQWGDANLTGALLTKMDLRAIAIGNKVSFSGASLAGVTFKAGQDLSSANLSGADLSGVDLSHLLLTSANLDGALLAGCTVAGLDLSQATCAATDFSKLDLSTVKLPTATGAMGQGTLGGGAIFVGATVPVASLGADWRNLDLSTTILKPPRATTAAAVNAADVNLHQTVLEGVTFALDAKGNGASLRAADLTGASLRGASLEAADFSSAILYSANLSNADLTSTIWSNAFLGDKQLLFTLSPYAAGDVAALNGGSVPADLATAFASSGHKLASPVVKTRSNSSAWVITDGSTVYSVVASANAFDVLTSGATSAQLIGAHMENANLTGGSFAGVHLKGVQLIGDSATAAAIDFEQADFSGANISSATQGYPDLSGAYLYGANFDNAFLFNASFANALLSPSTNSMPASLSGAMLAAATLTGAQLDGTEMTDALIGLSPQGAPTPFAGVPLFTLDATTYAPVLAALASSGIEKTVAIEKMQAAFASNGISLAGPVYLTFYPSQWGISITDQDDPNSPPTPAAAGWVWTGFMVMAGNPALQGTGDFIVYGTMFWMFAPDLTGALNPEPYIVAATNFTSADIADTTYCPNSLQWSTNLANGIPWEAAMMPSSQGQVKLASQGTGRGSRLA